MRVAEAVYQRVDRKSGQPVPGKYEFTYRDATGRQVWQTAKGETKAAAKAERAETIARLYRGGRIERTELTVAQAARAWLERGVGQKGRWAPSTAEGYERIVRLHIDRSNDPRVRPLGSRKLRELTVDEVAAWSQANERALAPTTAVIALTALNLICRFALRRGGLVETRSRSWSRRRSHTGRRGRSESWRARSSPACSTWRAPTGRCSSSSPTRAAGSGRRSASAGLTWTLRPA
jgi:hypothetical protein